MAKPDDGVQPRTTTHANADRAPEAHRYGTHHYEPHHYETHHYETHHYETWLAWDGSTAVGYDAYSRAHRAGPAGADLGLDLSADPAFRGDASRRNPEQLLVLAASSCQLLSFLAVAARARLDVISYRDTATAVMPERDDNRTFITEIHLEPHIEIRGEVPLAKVTRLVDLAHHECYIANSLRTEIHVSPTVVFVPEAHQEDE